MRRQTTITMIILLVVLLTAGVINLLQFTNANTDMVISATPGNIQATSLKPCAAGDVVFVVSLNRPADVTISVDFASADGTAKRDTDYTGKAGTITFDKGIRDQLVCITPLSKSQSKNTFTLQLTKAVGARLAITSVPGNLQST